MDNVAYDVLDKFPELPPNIHWGEVLDFALALEFNKDFDNIYSVIS